MPIGFGLLYTQRREYSAVAESEHPDQSSRHVGNFFLRAIRASRARVPVSFYLSIAMVVVLVLGAQMVLVREDPKRFAFYLALMFIFFFVVIFRAVIDGIEIAKKHFREREDLFHDTLGDADFVSELGKRVEEGERKKTLEGEEGRHVP